jgi:hypothetical protein
MTEREVELCYCKYCARRTTHRAWLLTGGNNVVCESCHTNKPKHLLPSRAEEEIEGIDRMLIKRTDELLEGEQIIININKEEKEETIK